MGREFGYLGLRLIQYVLLFIGTLVVARALGPTGRAHYALPLALSGAAWVVTHLTIEGSAGRLLGRREATLEDLLATLSTCTLVLAAVAVVATLIVGYVGSSAFLGGAPFSTVAVASLSIPGLLAIQVAGYVLLMLGRLRLNAAIAVVSAVAQLVLVLVLAVIGHLTPFLAVLATTLGFTLGGGLMFIAVARELGPRVLVPRLDRKRLAMLLRVSAGIHPLTVAIQLGSRLELLIVAVLASTRSTGLYSLALTISAMPIYAALTLAQAGVQPITERSTADAIDYACEFTRQSALMSIGIAFSGCAIAYPVVVVIYGHAWTGAVVPLMILILGTVAWSIENPLRVLLLRIAQPLQMAAIAVGGVLINAGLTVVLMQPFGIIGAALASLLAYWVLALAMLTLASRAAGELPLARSLRRPSREDWVVGQAFHFAGRLRSLVLN